MAGIGFTLKRLFREEAFTSRTKAYLYSALVAAGPWIAAVITVNSIIFVMEFFEQNLMEKELFMGTIVYSFVFSQLVTAPWQLVITRYVADKLYCREYELIRPSFLGLTKICVCLGLLFLFGFYMDRPLPLYYKLMSGYLFILITVLWVLMVYISTLKNYELIAKAYIYGGLLSIALTIIFISKPIPFPTIEHASNLLLAYLLGLSLSVLILLYNFLSTFHFGSTLEYDFIAYLSYFPSLFMVGLFYTAGLWIDDIIMWFSPVAVDVYNTYQYAPIYDNAVFLAYLTIIPTMVIFMVSVETEFYDCYKKYYELANKKGTYSEINDAKHQMEETVYRKLVQTFENQALITITIYLLAGPIFDFLNMSILIRDIFKISIIGALFNIITFVIILILLYFEVRKRAAMVSGMFFGLNFLLTKLFLTRGLAYYGYGFTLASLISLLVALVILISFLRNLNFTTFALQPVYPIQQQGIFVKLSLVLNKYKQSQTTELQKEK